MVNHGGSKNSKMLEGNRITRRDFLKAGGAIIASVSLLHAFSSCNSQIASETTSETSSTPFTNISTSNSPLNPKYGGKLKTIESPMTANIGWPFDMIGAQGALVYCAETLVRGDDKGNIVPWLAESFKIADDKKSISFTIRKGINFHDNSKLNAEAVKWNLDNYIKAGQKPNWDSVEVIDEYNIQVYFTKWLNTLPSSFGDTAAPAPFLVSKQSFEKNGIDWMRANPVTTGPYKFVGYQQDVNLQMVRYPDYWVKNKPYLDSIENILVSEPNTQKILFKSGEADAIGGLLPRDAREFSSLGMKIMKMPGRTRILVPDTANSDSPWANSRVRQAAEYCIDREGIAKAFGYGYMQPMYQLPPRGTLSYNTDFSHSRNYDPQKAKQLLSDAGYPQGFQTKLIAMPLGDSQIAQSIQSNLADVGIKAEVEYPTMGKWVTYLGSGTWNNAILYMGVPVMDIYFVESCQWMLNTIGKGWDRPAELVEALETAITSPTQDVMLVRKVTDLISENALLIPIHEEPNYLALRPYVMGLGGSSEQEVLTLLHYEGVWLNNI